MYYYISGRKCEGRKKLTLKRFLMTVLIILSFAVPMPYVSGLIGNPIGLSEDEITFPLYLNVKTPSRLAERFFKVFIYRLDEDGTRLVKSDIMDIMEGESARILLTIEKIRYKPLSKSTKVLMGSVKVYKNINYRVVVFGAEGRGGLAISIDPAEIEVKGEKAITIIEAPYPDQRTLSRGEVETLQEGELVEWDEKWRLTHIVTFHSWNTIDTYFLADVGSKVAVAEKVRNSYQPWGEPLVVGEWMESGGKSVVTIEDPRRSPGDGWWTEDERHEIYFRLLYRYERWKYEYAGLDDYWEYVNVIDTSRDPRGSNTVHGDLLPGNGVSDPWNRGEYDFGSPDNSFGFYVKGHGGEALRWSVSIGFGAQWPPGVAVSVSVNVWKEYQDPSPMYVYVYPHTPPPDHPDYKGYIYDDGTKQMKLFLTWAPLPP